MNAPLAALDEFEVLHRIGHIKLFAVEPKLLDCLIEQLAGGPHKRLAREVFLVAGLLTHQHERRMRQTRAEHPLRCGLVQLAAFAARQGVAQYREGVF